MMYEDVRAEVERQPFIPLRLHLVSGKEVDLRGPGAGWMLRHALMVLQDPTGIRTDRYDLIAVRNIERIEQLQAA
jgi:hypothetical protein